jgi:hypothetical protein
MTLSAPQRTRILSGKRSRIFFFTNQNNLTVKSPTSRTKERARMPGNNTYQECVKNETDYVTDPLAEWSNS